MNSCPAIRRSFYACVISRMFKKAFSINKALLIEFAHSGFPNTHGYIGRQLEAGRCLILLDGLDKVNTAAEHRRVIGLVQAFADQVCRAMESSGTIRQYHRRFLPDPQLRARQTVDRLHQDDGDGFWRPAIDSLSITGSASASRVVARRSCYEPSEPRPPVQGVGAQPVVPAANRRPFPTGSPTCLRYTPIFIRTASAPHHHWNKCAARTLAASAKTTSGTCLRVGAGHLPPAVGRPSRNGKIC